MGPAVTGLLAQPGFNLGPFLLPSTGANHIPEGQHGIDVLVSPVHPRAFQAGFDHQFVATQLLAFKDFGYKPVTEMKTYTGKTAEAFAQLF